MKLDVLTVLGAECMGLVLEGCGSVNFSEKRVIWNFKVQTHMYISDRS